MTEIIALPLSKLDADPKNVRKTYTAESIDSLASSILANGVLQNIVVRKGAKGRFFVSAGGRRLAALKLLAEKGDIEKDFPVNSIIREAENATEISLTENVMREAMHPADQYVAFRAMADEGKSIKDIAARFGTTEIIVNRRLALAKVSPVLFELYRNDELSFEQLSAFTICDDHARQEEVWNSLQSWDRHANTIKRHLTAEDVPAHDKRLTFIGGLDAYEQAGGPVRRDLFDGRGGYACDSGLLERLVFEKLETFAEELRLEGWKWVQVTTAQPDNIYQMARIYPQRVELSEAEQAKLDDLTAQYDDLAAKIEQGPEDEEAEKALSALEDQIEQLGEREEFEPESIKLAGAIVTLDHWGKVSILRGIVRDEDRQKATDGGGGEGEDEVAKEEQDGKKVETLTHSATLIEDLTAQKTAALRIELAHNSDIALVAVVHSLLLSTVYRGQFGMGTAQSALQISLTHERLEGSLKQPDQNTALQAWEDMKENYGHKLPGNPSDLWEWLLDQSRDELLNLLAFAAAHSVNAVELKYSGDRKEAFAHANQLGQALSLNMADYFTPTAESYFSHLNRQSIGAVVAEVCGQDYAAGVSNMKKADAAEYAEKSVKGTGWLPLHIRIPVSTGDDAEDSGTVQFPVAAE